jgi:Phospholipase_D-nuclease N-terminal
LGGQHWFAKLSSQQCPAGCAPAPTEEVALEFIFGLIVLALDIWAIVNIIGSTASTGAKILWTLLILILPIVGFIIWFFAGPRSRTSTV